MKRKLKYGWACTPPVSPAMMPPPQNDANMIFPSYNGILDRVFPWRNDNFPSPAQVQPGQLASLIRQPQITSGVN